MRVCWGFGVGWKNLLRMVFEGWGGVAFRSVLAALVDFVPSVGVPEDASDWL